MKWKWQRAITRKKRNKSRGKWEGGNELRTVLEGSRFRMVPLKLMSGADECDGKRSLGEHPSPEINTGLHSWLSRNKTWHQRTTLSPSKIPVHIDFFSAKMSLFLQLSELIYCCCGSPSRFASKNFPQNIQ